jgi:hypothetical protein
MKGRETGSGRVVNVREDYRAFLAAKVVPGVRYEGDCAVLPSWDEVGTDVRESIGASAPHLHGYQRFAVAFAVARQRAALFLECGLGKTHIGTAWLPAPATFAASVSEGDTGHA